MPGSSTCSLEEHSKILDLIKRGAYEEAKKVMKEHLAYTFEFLRNRLFGRMIRENQ